MPVSRTGSKQSSRQTSQHPELLKDVPTDRQATEPVDDDVIVISSDEDDIAREVARRRKNRAKSKAQPRQTSSSIIEILDGDTDKRSSSKSTHELRNEIKKLKERQLRHDKYVKELQSKYDQMKGHAKILEARLESQTSTSSSTASKLISDLDDSLCCEICTLKMWTPYNLSCGHTFCATCLTDWFSTALTQYMTTHPDYQRPANNGHYPAALPVLPDHLRQVEPILRQYTALQPRQRQALGIQMRQLLMEYEPYMEQERMFMQGMRARQHGPQYTCPTCRTEVKTKPAEVFSFKATIQTVAAATGESSPQRGSDNHIWDGFF